MSEVSSSGSALGRAQGGARGRAGRAYGLRRGPGGGVLLELAEQALQLALLGPVQRAHQLDDPGFVHRGHRAEAPATARREPQPGGAAIAGDRLAGDPAVALELVRDPGDVATG